MNIREILSDQDFGLRMRFSRGDAADFYRSGNHHASVIAERRKWITGDPLVHVALMPPGVGLLDETLELADALGTIPGISSKDFSGLDPLGRCKLLGEHWEADFLLMKPDEQGIFRLYGGCLCFPSHWDLRQKLGLPIADIHAPVPGLNETLGRQIDGFLRQIKPGISWERFNWGLSRTPELNLHPARGLPRLDAGVTLDDVWFRLEEQSLVSLPVSGGILFGIKLVILPMRGIKSDPEASQGMIRALRTMPEPIAAYKGIAPVRERLLELMEEG